MTGLKIQSIKRGFSPENNDFFYDWKMTTPFD